MKYFPLSEHLRDMLQDVGFLVMRVWIGAVMIVAHGWPKLANFSELSQTFADPLGVGSATSLALTIFAEIGCSILIIFGLGTRIIAFPLLFTMLIAAFVIHGDDPWRQQEFPLLFGFVYLMLMLTGPGKLSIDHLLVKKLQRIDHGDN